MPPLSETPSDGPYTPTGEPRALGADVAAFGNLQGALIFGALVVGLYICYLLALPFLTPMAVALVLAILFTPLHLRITRRFHAPALAASLTLIVIATIVLVPLAFLGAELVKEAAAGASLIRDGIESGFIEKTLSTHPKTAHAVTWVIDRIDLQGLAGAATSRLTDFSASFVRVSIVQFVGVLLTFYLLFYFLRDRADALGSVRSFLPFTAAETTAIYDRVVDAVHATIYGTVITGVIQGILGGLIFAVVGLSAPLLWGLVIGLFAILPVLGTVMVWLPAAVWLALNEEWMRASIVTVAFIGLGIFDSALYPALVGNRMRLHTALTFVSAVGGLMLFGAAGFILGPLVVAVTLAIKDILRARMPLRPPAVDSGPG